MRVYVVDVNNVAAFTAAEKLRKATEDGQIIQMKRNKIGRIMTIQQLEKHLNIRTESIY